MRLTTLAALLDALRIAEKLHNSHFYNVSVAATSQKHKMLIENAKSRINTKLHPFVLSEQKRLKSKKHLKVSQAMMRSEATTLVYLILIYEYFRGYRTLSLTRDMYEQRRASTT